MSKFEKPTFNVVLPFSSILAAAEIHGVTFRGWEIRARFSVPLSSPSAPPKSPFHLPPVLSSAGSSSHFHVVACFVPPSYLCNGCTTGHGSRERNVFQAHFSRPPDAGSSLFEDSCPCSNAVEIYHSRKKWQSSVPFKIVIVVAVNNDIHRISYYLSMSCYSIKPNINYKF